MYPCSNLTGSHAGMNIKKIIIILIRDKGVSHLMKEYAKYGNVSPYAGHIPKELVGYQKVDPFCNASDISLYLQVESSRHINCSTSYVMFYIFGICFTHGGRWGER